MRFSGRVPVTPGPDIPMSDCAACGAAVAGGVKVREVHGEVDMALCFDFMACTNRYRGGGSPAAYAELLAVST